MTAFVVQKSRLTQRGKPASLQDHVANWATSDLIETIVVDAFVV